MTELPKRIKQISEDAIPKFRTHSGLFFLCWLFAAIINILFIWGPLDVSERIQAFMLLIWLIFLVVSIIFLVLTLRVLYRPNYFWGNLLVYIILGFIPFSVIFCLPGVLGVAVALSVFIDSRKVVKAYPVTGDVP